MNTNIKNLEKQLDYQYSLLIITKEIAYGVGAGRVVNRPGKAHRDVAEVRANAFIEVEQIKSEIDKIYSQLIEAEKVGA